MNDYSKDFSLDPRQTWLNVASEGPLPNVAAKKLEEFIALKQSPHLLTIPKFHQVPLELKLSLAHLINADFDDIILGNSATYGIHLMANGISFAPADEIILLQNDFPTDILPWLSLERKNVIVKQIKAQKHVLTADEIRVLINPKTKLICLPLVHSFTGYKQDMAAIGRLCREHGIILVANVSQAAGVMPIDVQALEIDALVCAGYKWLLGPYGTGFCWMTKALRETLDYPQNYWISLMDEKELSSEGILSLNDDHSSRRYDVFGTANFFNYAPWRASIEYLLSIGIESVYRHNQDLISQIIDGIDHGYDIVSPKEKNERSNILVFSSKDKTHNAFVLDYLKQQNFHLAFWKGNLRVSPHIYNTEDQIKNFVKTLNSCN